MANKEQRKPKEKKKPKKGAKVKPPKDAGKTA